ncbi:metallophosphoesterase family protein [Bacillus horti]|uniref:DNA repair exonuclease SbcCD nuclease subunit n=1 Tax=Caldalkalibacillus horti TaxID=77523 RepID=A0ABT9W3Z9_9BACI|nr:DNA repair exonuclease [Bacillus horti]MDQ0167980.1 DNA repair exonuclease SbcCD nuclease subunit [Bacillus horti]
MSFRFIHTADIHLGSPFKGLVKVPEKLKKRIIHSVSQAFQEMITFAIDQEIDFIVISGDIFDQSHRSVQAQLLFKNEMERLHQAGIMCYIIHGNHDPLDGTFIELSLPPNVYVFPANTVGRQSFTIEGREVAHIYGISYETAKVSRNLATLFTREDEELFSLGMLHTNCEGDRAHENYAPCSRQDLLDAGLDYWALGHVHQRKVLQQTPFIGYPGNIQGRHIREHGEKGFFVVTVEENRVLDVAFEAVQQFVWLEQEVDVTDLETVDELMERLEQDIEKLEELYSGSALILRLKGTGITELANILIERETIEGIVQHIQQGQEYGGENESNTWLESFSFHGTSSYLREDARQTSAVFQDIMNLVDHWESNQSNLEEEWSSINKELLKHQRAKVFLEPFSPDEQKEVLRQAESYLLHEWLGDSRR